MRKIIPLLLAAFLCVQGAFAIDLVFDGQALETDVQPIVVDGRTLVPMRAIFEKFGATVQWDDATKTATAVKDDLTIALMLGSDTAVVNGVSCTLDVPAQAIDGRTMVPVRFVSETLGANVEWVAETQTVIISTDVATSAGVDNPAVKSDGVYIGSVDSDKYHYPNCRYAKTILSENEIWFDTTEEAQAMGYSACGHCRPS